MRNGKIDRWLIFSKLSALPAFATISVEQLEMVTVCIH